MEVRKTSSLPEILQKAAEAGVFLSIGEKGLRFKLAADVFPEEVKREILANKAALIDFLKRRRASEGGALSRLPLPQCARRPEQPCVLSFAQRRLWFIDRMGGGSPQYDMPGAARIKGRFEEDVAERALRRIIERHEVLRTVYEDGAEGPMQRVRQEFEFRLRRVDLRELERQEQERRVREEMEADASKVFDLSCDLMLRASYLRLGEEEGVLLYNTHHIASDGWLTEILVREFGLVYEAYLEGGRDPLPDLGVHYVDYAEWQREWLQGEELERQLGYWRSKLKDTPTLDLLTDRKRPSERRRPGGRQSLRLSQSLSDALTDFGKHEQSTLFMVLLAAFKLLLHRYTGSCDIVVGTPVAGRKRQELEPLIGCFLNTVVLRTEIPEDASFTQVLHKVREIAVDAYSHEDTPFEKVLEEINPKRAVSRTPLFQVFVNMLALSDPLVVELPGVVAEIIELPETSTKFDLTLYIYAGNGKIEFSLVYDADLFVPERIEEMLRQFEYLLKQIIDNPEEKIGRFSLVTPAAQLILPNPRAALDSKWEGAVHELFRIQAGRNPLQLAVVDPDARWSYLQLDHLSNRLASYLSSERIRSGDVVAIYAHRSAPLVAALLGIMKAGAAFLILDPAYPPARLVNYLEAAQPKALLHLEPAGDLPREMNDWVTASACRKVTLPGSNRPECDRAFENFTSAALATSVSADDLAYISFTSGSVGKPKGVLGRHGPLSHFGPWLEKTFDLKESDRFSVFSGLSHDPLHRDVFLPLMIGATVVFPDPVEWRLPGRAAKWAKDNGITVMNLTPATAQLIAVNETEKGLTLDAMRRVFFVGDVLTRRDISLFSKLAPAAKLVNFYGATESQQALSFFPVPLRDGIDFDSREGWQEEVAPVGHGFKDVQLLVVNRERQLCGVGELGEIYFRSPHLARGYLNDPELSSEKFTHNWFTGAADDRFYKTGDLGRYLPDGCVEMLGRTDTQVKVRGFRVELGEIEATLKRQPMVRAAAVALRQGSSGDQRLVGYVVLDREQTDWQRELLERIADKLPDYMAPTAFVALDELPLTPNGKVDRKALPAPESALTLDEYVAPATPTEIALSRIWADLLKLDPKSISVTANFFELGGHSLLSARLVSQIRAQFGAELRIRDVFETPQLSLMAVVIEQGGGRVARPRVVAVGREADCAPVSFEQRRLWFIDQLGGGSAQYNMPGAVWIRGRFDEEIAERVLRCIIQRHEALRTVFLNGEDGPLQRIQAAPDFHLRRIDLSGLSREAQEQVMREELDADALKPFDLSADLMLRASFIRLSGEEGALLFNMHHIASDGWLMGVLVNEFGQLYEAFSQDKPDPLAPLAIQYADYAQWQRDWLKGELLERQLSYWEMRLTDLPEAHEMPLDRPRPAAQTFNGVRYDLEIDRAGLDELKRLALNNQATLFMVVTWSVCVVAVPPREQRRHSDRDAGSESSAKGTRAAGGLLCQYAGIAC